VKVYAICWRLQECQFFSCDLETELAENKRRKPGGVLTCRGLVAQKISLICLSSTT